MNEKSTSAFFERRFVFEPSEPPDDPFEFVLWPLFNSTLQPDSQESAQEIVARILPSLPAGKPRSIELSTFICVCYEACVQIPPGHPSMIKLAEIMDRCLNSPLFPGGAGSSDYGMWLRIHWDCCHADEMPTAYVRLQAFISILDARLEDKYCTLEIGALQDAFEDARRHVKTPAGRKACILAALLNLLLCGMAIYLRLDRDNRLNQWRYWRTQVRAVIEGEPIVLMEEAIDRWKISSWKQLFDAGNNLKHMQASAASWLGVTRWRLWLERFRGVRPVKIEREGEEKAFNGETFDESGGQYPREMVEMAIRARTAMNAVESARKNNH